MERKLKAAVIGLGRMGAQLSSRFEGQFPDGWLPLSHAEAFRSTEGIELVALCDKDTDRLEEFSKLYDIPAAYTDYKQMIREVQPDIISVATRTDIRCGIIHFAAENNVKGFYAEKPLSRSIQECREVLAVLETHDCKIVYGATRRAMDVYKKAKEICYSGEIGKVQQIHIEFGRAAMMWSHAHSVDMITYFADSTDFTLVQGWCNIEEGALKSDLLIDHDPIVEHAYFMFQNGISATITQTAGHTVRIACTHGIVTINGNGYFIEVNREKEMRDYFHGIEEIKVKAEKSGTQQLVEDLKNAVLHNHPVKHISPKEILCGQQMLFGIAASTLAGGKMISPDEINEGLLITGRTGKLYA